MMEPDPSSFDICSSLGSPKTEMKTEFLSSFAHSPAYAHWKDVGAQKGLYQDEEIACFLLKYYEDTREVFPSGSTLCKMCGTPLSVSCARCEGTLHKAEKNRDGVETKQEGNGDCDDGGEHEHSGPDLSDGAEPVRRMLEAGQGVQVSTKTRTEIPIAPQPQLSATTGPAIDPSVLLRRHYLPILKEGAKKNDKPLYVNAKQYHRILKRREARKKLEACGKIARERQKYLHESRHNHALNRERGVDGRYLPVADEMEEADRKETTNEEAGSKGKRRREKTAPANRSTLDGLDDKDLKAARSLLAHKHQRPSSAYCQIPGSGQQAASVKTILPSALKSSMLDVSRKTFKQASVLKARKRARGPKSFVCDVCNKSFTRANNLKKHKMIHTGQKPFMCDICSRAFTRVDDLKKHKIIHTGQKPFMCDECGKSFTQSASLRTHKMIHTGLKSFVCDVCCRAFTHAGNLKTHKLIHTGQKSFMCDVCSMIFTRASNLKKHKMIHSGYRPFMCDVCSKGFTRADELTKHKMVHTGQKPFMCEICNKTFTMASILRRHKIIHTGEKPFVCDVCSKAFTEEGNLKRHKMIHTGHKPFSCDVCTKSFTHAGDLKKHKMIHTGEKPFMCDVCSKAFTLAGSLKRHKMTHTGQKSFMCEMCSKTSPLASHLKPNTLMYSGQKSFMCNVCRKTFTEAGTVFYGP